MTKDSYKNFITVWSLIKKTIQILFKQLFKVSKEINEFIILIQNSF